MKTKLILLSIFMISKIAFASELTCTNDKFPKGIGSTLRLEIDANGEPMGEAELYLHDNASGSNLQTNGWFQVLPPTFNEDRTTVNYFDWSAGAGLGENGTEHLKLIPRKMVTYALKENYEHDKTLFLGIIEWVPNGKMERHYIYQCQSTKTPTPNKTVEPNCCHPGRPSMCC